MPIIKKSSTIIALAILGIINLVVIAGFFCDFWSLKTNRDWIAVVFAGLHLIILICLLFYFRGQKNKEGKRESISVTESVPVFSVFIGSMVFLALFIFLAIFFFSPGFGKKSDEQIVAAHFETIRKDQSSLTSFFKEMPKGGDLHHHFTGSVFAETYWDALVERDGWINLTTFEIDTPGVKKAEGWKTCSQLLASKQLPYYKQKIIQQWSVKDYHPALAPSDKHFFDAFDKFRPMSNILLESGLKEIKERALSENVSYIETMLTSFDTTVTLGTEAKWTDIFKRNASFNSEQLRQYMDTLYGEYTYKKIEQAAVSFVNKIGDIHHRLQLDDSVFLMRYVTYTNRTSEPLQVFRRLLLSFEAANRSNLFVGVNFVAPEDNQVSMRDYLLHMQMFEFFHGKYPEVKISLHSGELAPGLVKPELLKSHIKDAVFTGKASRIGHGVDIAAEEANVQTLQYMRDHTLAVEINIVSNEFILKVKDGAHPILLYHKYGVPIVLSTDDAGILRSDLTTQFVLAALRYPTLSYKDLKTFVRNSILYSFIEDKTILDQKLKKLDESFAVFEKNICERIKAESKLK